MNNDVVVGETVVAGRHSVIDGNGVTAQGRRQGSNELEVDVGRYPLRRERKAGSAAELRLDKMSWPPRAGPPGVSDCTPPIVVTPMPATEKETWGVSGAVGRHVDMVRGKLGIAGVGKIEGEREPAVGVGRRQHDSSLPGHQLANADHDVRRRGRVVGIIGIAADGDGRAQRKDLAVDVVGRRRGCRDVGVIQPGSP